MYQRPIIEEPSLEPETGPSPLRGLLIAVPVALGLWIAVAAAAFLL